MLKNIKLDKKLKNKIGLMGSCLMNNVLYMFLNTFMIAYFITLTNYNYKIISIYYILTFIFIMLTFLGLGKIIKNRDQIYTFRIGIVLHCIYVLVISVLKEDIVNYYFYLGMFYGIVQGVFWAPAHTLINEYVGKDSDKFVSIKTMIDKMLKILFPVIFGISIELTSFSYIARIVLIISFIQFVFSLLINDDSVISKKKYGLKQFILNFRNNVLLNTCYKMSFCDGIISYLLDTLITIVIVMTFKTTISLGFLTTLFAICSIISIYVYQNKIKNKKKCLLISCVGMAASIILLLININKITLVLYNLCAGVFLVILRNEAQAKRYNIISNIKEVENSYLVEYQVVSEVLLNIARIIGYSILFFASIFNNMILFKILLGLVIVVILFYSKYLIEMKDSKNI